MVQRHSIILWRKAEKEDKSFEEIARETYEVLNIFQTFPQNLRPNFLVGQTKKDVKNVEWNYQNFCILMKKGVNKEGENIYEDLGYSISLFSSMDEEDSCGFQIRAGNKNERFYNTFLVNLPLTLNLFDEKEAKKVVSLFKKLVHIYMPYWGCVSNKMLSRKYGKFLEGNLPTTVHWLNYWSEDITRIIGMNKMQKLVKENPTISFENGILLINNTALDLDKEGDVMFHDNLQKQLYKMNCLSNIQGGDLTVNDTQ